MNRKIVYQYVFDTMADWEIGYLTAELNSGRYYKKGLEPSKIITVSLKKTPIITMGGMKIIPDIAVEELRIENIDALILPGGDTWTDSVHEPILLVAEQCIREGILVAAICGATFGLARKGVLDSREHTSNDLEYLKFICPAYQGEQAFRREAAVTEGNLITASGIAPLEFARHVIQALEVFSEQTLAAWYQLYSTQDGKYFYELMNSIQ